MRFVNVTAAKARAVDAVLVERVRRDLHRDRVDAVVAHPREQGLEIGRLGRGVTKRDDLAVDPRLDGPDHAGAVAAGACDRLEQIGRAGLAVRARDTQDAHRLRRVPVKAGAQRTEDATDRIDAGLGCADREHPLDEQRDRPGPQGRRRVVVTVAARTGNAAEQRAGSHLPAVVHDRAEVDRSRLGPRGRGRAPRGRRGGRAAARSS